MQCLPVFVGQQLFVESIVVHNLGHEAGISQQGGAQSITRHRTFGFGRIIVSLSPHLEIWQENFQVLIDGSIHFRFYFFLSDIFWFSNAKFIMLSSSLTFFSNKSSPMM